MSMQAEAKDPNELTGQYGALGVLLLALCGLGMLGHWMLSHQEQLLREASSNAQGPAPKRLEMLVEREPAAVAEPSAAPLAGISETATPDAVPDPLQQQQQAALAELESQAAQIHFAPQASRLDEPARRLLGQVFQSWFLYPETQLEVRVASGDFDRQASNRLVSRGRAQAIVDFLLELGVPQARLSIGPDDAGNLPGNEHRVEIRATLMSR